MPNVLTALESRLFSTARVVPKEMTGFIGAVRRDFNDQGVAKGGTVKVPVVPKMTVGTIPTPSMSFAAGSDRTPTTIDLVLNQTAEISWNMSAEDERSLLLGGTAQDVLMQTVEQGWRGLRNQIEAYLGTVAKNSASRAAGAAGTTPFASTTAELVAARKILADNGSASRRRTAVLNTAAEANLLALGVLQKASEAGDSGALREGIIGRLHGVDIAISAGVQTHTKGAGTGGLVNAGSGLAVGVTTIPYDTLTVNTTGIKAGDVITFAADSVNAYVVKTGTTATSGNIEIQEPGLLVAIPDNNAITVGNSSTDNIVLGESGLVAVVRPALQPISPEIEQLPISDLETGFTALLIRKVGDGMASWYMRQVYDAFAPNPYEIAKLRG